MRIEERSRNCSQARRGEGALDLPGAREGSGFGKPPALLRAARAAAIGSRAAAIGALAWLVLVAPSTPAAETHRDPKALAVADSVEQAIAPDGAWGKIAGLRFTFNVVKDGSTQASIRHLWDTRTGRYRVEWKSREGVEYAMIFDVGTKQGGVWTAKAPPAAAAGAPGSPPPAAGAAAAPRWTRSEPPESEKLLERGYGRFINDTYWLLMPLKMKDPGVNLDYDGEKTAGAETYDVVKLTFDHVGLTPGDTYWVWVNRKTHLVDRWEFLLEGQQGQPRSEFDWTDWSAFGPLRLSTKKTTQPGNLSIVFTDVEALASIPEGAFDPPK